MSMKPRTLVIATMAWTAGIVGCADEQRVAGAVETKEGVLNSSSVAKVTIKGCSAKVKGEKPGSLTAELENSVPLIIGGEKAKGIRLSGDKVINST